MIDGHHWGLAAGYAAATVAGGFCVVAIGTHVAGQFRLRPNCLSAKAPAAPSRREVPR